MSEYYVLEDEKLYAFPTVQRLREWIIKSRELQTFPVECGAKYLGVLLDPNELTEEILDQFTEQERLDKDISKRKVNKKLRYRNRR